MALQEKLLYALIHDNRIQLIGIGINQIYVGDFHSSGASLERSDIGGSGGEISFMASGLGPYQLHLRESQHERVVSLLAFRNIFCINEFHADAVVAFPVGVSI